MGQRLYYSIGYAENKQWMARTVAESFLQARIIMLLKPVQILENPHTVDI